MAESYTDNPLWEILVETVHSTSMYRYHKAYVREKIIVNDPFIQAEELSNKLSISRGEAMVILHELRITLEELNKELSTRFQAKRKFDSAVMGGTFNEIHHGHLGLLLTAFKYARKVVIGLTSDEYVKTREKSHPVLAYEKRHEGLRQALHKYGWLERATIVKIDDAFGPSTSDPSLEAIIVSLFTAGMVDEINRIRLDRMLRPLEPVISPMVLAEDGKPISSSRVSAGEITLDGKVAKK